MSRANIKKVLGLPKDRRELMIQVIMSLQAVAGIETTREQAEQAYDKVLAENAKRTLNPSS